jgi:hypothetical protein
MTPYPDAELMQEIPGKSIHHNPKQRRHQSDSSTMLKVWPLDKAYNQADCECLRVPADDDEDQQKMKPAQEQRLES